MEGRVVFSDGDVESPRGTKFNPKEGKTRQSDGEAADINVIVKRYQTSGELPLGGRQGVFADVSEMPTFAEALEQVNRTREWFMQLPPDVRALFDNEPARMLDAWNAGEQREVFERIGMVKAEEPQAEPEAKGEAKPVEKP